MEEAADGGDGQAGHDMSEDEKVVEEVALVIVIELVLQLLYTVHGSID